MNKKKIALSIITLILVFTLPINILSQEKQLKKLNHIIFLELAGMTYLGASLNYECSIKLLKAIRLNPGIGAGYEFRVYDSGHKSFFNYYPSIKTLIGSNHHFLELGIYANFTYDNPIGGLIGYRYCLLKNPMFFRLSVHRIEDATTRPIWAGLSIGLRL